jgi:hypothetical protein
MTTPHDTACELRGRNHFSGNRSCHCELRALKAELVALRAERDAAQQEPRRDPPTALRSSMSDAVRRLGFWVPGFHDY